METGRTVNKSGAWYYKPKGGVSYVSYLVYSLDGEFVVVSKTDNLTVMKTSQMKGQWRRSYLNTDQDKN